MAVSVELMFAPCVSGTRGRNLGQVTLDAGFSRKSRAAASSEQYTSALLN
jgi:hypothetical protein